jgi:hypothetical protein
MTLTRPIPGDPLSSSNGKPSTQILDEAFDLVDAHELSLSGPVFTNPNAFTPVQSVNVLTDGTTSTGFFTVNASAGLTLQEHYPGYHSVDTVLHAGAWDNSAGTAALGWNAPAPITVGTNTQLDIELYFVDVRGPLGLYITWAGSGWPIGGPEMIADWVISDGVNFTGNVYRRRVVAHHSTSGGSHMIAVHNLSTIRCIGIQLARPIDLPTIYPGQLDYTLGIGRIMWSTQTQAQKALSGTTPKAIVIPSSYVPDATAVSNEIDAVHRGRDVGYNKSSLDLRPGHEIISNFNGFKYARQFDGGPYEDGKPTADSVHLYADQEPAFDFYNMFALLEDGDTLSLPANSRYYIRPDASFHMIGKKRITVEGNGAIFWSDDASSRNPLMQFRECHDITMRNFKCYGLYPETFLGDAMATYSGSPTKDTSAHTATLASIGQAVACGSVGSYHADMDGVISMSLTLSRTGSKTLTNVADCFVEMVDENAPTAPSLAALNAEGPIFAGTYYYRCTYIDSEGQETGLGVPASITLATQARVNVVVPVAPVGPGQAPIVARRIYRTQAPTELNPTLGQNPWDSHFYTHVGTLNDNLTTSFHDSQPSRAAMQKAPTAAFTLADGGAGSMVPGSYTYWVTTVNSAGLEQMVFDLETTTNKTITSSGKVNISGLPTAGGILARRIYRAQGGGSASTRVAALVAEQRPGDGLWAGGTYVDTTTQASLLDATGYPRDHVPWSYGGSTDTDYTQPTCWAPNMVYPLLLTGGSTPTAYNVQIRPGDTRFLDRRYTPVLRKLTTEAVSIVVTSATQNCRRPSFQDGACFEVQDGCNNITFEKVDVIGYVGDHTLVRTMDNIRSTNITFRDCKSIQNARQGFAVTEGHDILFDGCEIVQPGRSGLDIEPYGLNESQVTRVVVRNCEFRAVGANCITTNSMVDNLIVDNCRFISSRGIGYGAAAVSHAAGGSQVSLTNIYAPWMGISLGAVRNVWVNGVTCENMSVQTGGTQDLHMLSNIGGGGAIMNVRLNALYYPGLPFACTDPNIFISNVTVNQPGPQGRQAFSMLTLNQNLNLYGPYSATGTAALMDPGVYKDRFPNTYKGINGGNLHFPIGLNMLTEPLVNVRGVSSTSVRPNNHRLTSAVTAGATSLTIPFPTKATEFPSGYELTGYTRAAASPYPAGSLVSGTTYFYRFGARSIHQGPTFAAFEASIALAGGNNAVRVGVRGLWSATRALDAVTIYRGTATGVYNTRYDIIPTSDPHALGVKNVDQITPFMDLGTQITIDTGVSGDPSRVGYDQLYAPTSTTNFTGTGALSGSNWLAVEQSGYENDPNYTVTTETSWPTPVGITKTLAGVTLTFGVACPVGGGTVTCMIGR